MIAANKRLLKATLTEGVLNIQSNLIDLYATNLNSLATQAALIAGFAFTTVCNDGISNRDDGFIMYKDWGWQKMGPYMYYLFFTVCVIASFFTLSQCTIVVMFGPSRALKGDTTESVKVAADHMRHQMFTILKIAFIAVTALFLGVFIYCWSHTPFELAIPTSLLYIGGYYTVLTYGMHTYNLFRLEHDITKDPDSDAKYHTDRAIEGGESGEVRDPGDVVHAAVQDINRLRYKGVLWKRRALEKGGTFFRVYAVIDKGNLDIYQSKDAYATHQNPINETPFKLYQYELETDPRKFQRTVTSIRSVLKKSVFGEDDFEWNDLIKNNKELKKAAMNCKFALLPKVQTELLSQEILEFIAPPTDYTDWMRWLRAAFMAFDEEGRPTVEQSVRKGTTDLFTAVRTANN